MTKKIQSVVFCIKNAYIRNLYHTLDQIALIIKNPVVFAARAAALDQQVT